MKSIKMFSTMMALLLVVGNISSAQRGRGSQFERYLQNNIKGKFFGMSSETAHQYGDFLDELKTIAAGNIDTDAIVPEVKEAKAKAIQDKMDLNVAADRVIKTMQADVRVRGQVSKESDTVMRSNAALVDKAVKAIFFGKSKSRATASSAGQRGRSSEFEKFLQEDVKDGITKDVYASFMTDLQDMIDDPWANHQLVPGIEVAKNLAIKEKMDLKVAADKLIKVMQANVRNLGLKSKEDDEMLRHNAAVVDEAVRTIFFFYDSKSSPKKQNNRPSSSRKPATRQSSYKK